MLKAVIQLDYDNKAAQINNRVTDSNCDVCWNRCASRVRFSLGCVWNRVQWGRDFLRR